MMIISGLLGIHIPTTKALRAVMLLAVALGAGAAFGGGRTLWQDGGVQLCGTSAYELLAATSDSAGGAIVVWTDNRDVYDGIYAQRVDAAGIPQWTENGVLLCDSTGQGYLAVADDGEGGAIAVWSAGGRPFAVQRVSGDGVPVWGARGVMLRPYISNLIEMPAIVTDGHGGAIVVWNAFAHFSGQVDTLLACRVDSSGTKQWETVVRIDTIDAPPCLCDDGLGGVIIAWQQYEAGVRHVRVQRVDSAGVTRWGAAGVRACTLSTTQAARACSAVGESRFVVGWFGGAGTWQHRAQMFDLVGNRLWGLAGMPVSGGFSSGSGSVGLPAGSAGQTAWIWTENRTGVEDLFAQKLDSTGARCWDSDGVWLGTSDASGFRGFSATVDGNGGAIASYSLYRSQLNWDIYAQHVDSAGNLCWSDTGLAVCPGSNNVTSPVAVSDGDGGAIVAWKDDRGLYVQRVADVPGGMELVGDERGAMNEGPTVVRGVLVLNGLGTRSELPVCNSVMSRAVLLDVSGREVMELQPGANDVRALAPGVYFLRGPKTEDGRPGAAVRKIVLTE
jgi:hypothetical protein